MRRSSPLAVAGFGVSTILTMAAEKSFKSLRFS